MKILTIKNSTILSMFKPFSAYLYCCWVNLFMVPAYGSSWHKIFNTVRKNSLLEKFLENLLRCFEKTLFQKRSITGKQVIPKAYYSYGSSTITPEENCPQIISSGTIAPWLIAHQLSAARTIAPEENCPLPENFLFAMKFCPKIIAPTHASFPQRVIRVNWEKLCIVYVYYN